MAEKILITGAAGLIGRELYNRLSSDYKVTAVDNNFRYPYNRPDIEYHNSDLIDFLKNQKNDFDYIFHLSAINGTKYFYEIPNQVLENNIRSDLDVFNFAKSNKNCKLIYASSSEVIADTDQFPSAEQKNIVIKNIHNPRWSYRLGKIVSENYLFNSHIDFLIIRFFNVFGVNSAPGHFVKDILDKIEKGDHTLIGHDETRSFCRVEDAVEALIKIYKRVSGKIINIGSDKEITVLDAANILADHKGKQIDWQLETSREGSVKRRYPSLKKLREYYPEYQTRCFKDSIKDF